MNKVQVQSKNLTLNRTLVQMYNLNNIMANGFELTSEEIKFYNDNLPKIKKYYLSKHMYWNNQQPI